jgi:hypothetical protein
MQPFFGSFRTSFSLLVAQIAAAVAPTTAGASQGGDRPIDARCNDDQDYDGSDVHL